MIENVIGVLYELADLYREIHGISLEKKEAVVSNNVERVGEIVKTEWTLLGKISDLEEKRLQMVREVLGADAVGDSGEAALEDICKHGTPEETKELKNAAEALRALIAEQKKINAENQALIGLHLDYTDYMINVFLKEPQAGNIYGNSGEVEEENPDHGIIDSSV